MKHYTDIKRVAPKYASQLQVGEPIVVEEKIDFSNAQIYMKDNEFCFCSRRKELFADSTINSDPFYEFVALGEKLDPMKFTAVFGCNYIVFGEWAGNPHKIKYPAEVKKKFWVFDVYDTLSKTYLPYTETKKLHKWWTEIDPVAKELCPFVPVFYEGAFESWDKLKELVGRTDIGASPCGEGIVIKRQSLLETENSKNPAYIKWVSEEFSEVQKVKKIDPETIKKAEREQLIVSSIVTKRRVEKQIEKAIEDGLIPYDWNVDEMQLIAKTIPTAVYKDCEKEEPEIVAQVEKFGKICSSLTMQIVRDILKEKNKI